MKPIPNISLKTLQKLVEKYKDKTFGTYDYDGIAVEVIKLVSGLNKKMKPTEGKGIICPLCNYQTMSPEFMVQHTLEEHPSLTVQKLRNNWIFNTKKYASHPVDFDYKREKEFARNLADNLERYNGKRTCPICGHDPEYQVEYVNNLLTLLTDRGGATTKVSREGATLKHTAKVRPKDYTHFTCIKCRKGFWLDPRVPVSALKKVKMGEDETFVMCPKCEFEMITPPQPKKIEKLGIETLIEPFDKIVPQEQVNNRLFNKINELIDHLNSMEEGK
jgi:transcription elongation factor Elf1